MGRSSPLGKLHREAEAAFADWPPPDAVHRGDRPAISLVDTFGDPGAELLAVRRGGALIDLPQRGCVTVTGADRVEFLNRMVTQELKDLTPFHARRAFWLNRKGRIDADLRLIHLPDRAHFDLDASVAESACDALSAFVFAEDVSFSDASEAMSRLALHGPESPAILRRVATHRDGASLDDLAPGSACVVEIAGRDVIVDRQDSLGVIGLELLTSTDGVADVYHQLLEAGASINGGAGEVFRCIGWRAYNTARMEAGWPLHLVDFGAGSLPHETGVLRDRVSFTKGCYLGQEVVARMESLGHPKQLLVALRLEGSDAPRAGTTLHPAADAESDPVGVVTSSSLSPALHGAPLCYAQVRYKHVRTGAELRLSDGRAGAILDTLSVLP